ncbi:MAG TPA: radical SAM protein [Vicinamibacterales bacterium]|jgi:MoaA/NifB/PqqE/SkfB family radical SAM enzyme|nr:radical SAM protein [Vicinamibacterales bacterium]
MELQPILASWGNILRGYTPALSIEITRECPLHCPGCYAYGDDHLGGGIKLREVRDLKDDELIEGVLALVDRHRPVHVSIVGGEPLVRYRELNKLLPRLSERGIYVQIVTSAVRDWPLEWQELPRFSLVVSVDGLQPEHDARRAPATYERILRNISGRSVTIHCTITRQQVQRPGYIAEFLEFWSARPEVRKIWYSLYTPQIGETSEECLTPADRERAIWDLQALRLRYPKLQISSGVLAAFAEPPQSPAECVFARMTTTISADLRTTISPCQFGGTPDCSNCGCAASAGMVAITGHRVFGVIPVGFILNGSLRVGAQMRRLRGSPVGDGLNTVPYAQS